MRFRLRVEARTRARAWFGLAIVIGLTSGVALAAAAGARRTETAYPRFRDAAEQEDIFLAAAAPSGQFDVADNPVLAAVDQLPAVTRTAALAQMATAPGRTLAEAEANFGFGSLSLLDGAGYAMSRPNLVAGRMPDPDRVDEGVVNPRYADQFGVGVGSRLPIVVVDSAAADASFSTGTPYTGSVDHETITVTGIVRFARDVVPTTVNDENAILYTTPAFYAKYPAALINYIRVLRLRPGADVERFRQQVTRVAGEQGVPPAGVYISAEVDRSDTIARAVRPQVLALAAVALVLALAVFLVTGQALSRQVFTDATDSPLLGAVGMTERQRFRLAITRVAIVSFTGAVLAVAVAIALSPLFPVGIARQAEPSPGLDVDVAMLLAGFAVVLVAFLVRGAFPAWRGAAARPGNLGVAEPSIGRPSRVTELLARAGVRPARVEGVRMAFEPGRGRTAVPVRSALVTTTIALTAVVAVLIFTVSLDRLVTTPERYGWNWTFATGFGFDPTPSEMTDHIAGDPGVEAVAGGNIAPMSVGGRTITVVAFDPVKGHVDPVILEGRAPRGDAEIALGTRSLRATGHQIGDRVRVRIGDHTGRVRIVGRAVFPRIGQGSFTPTDLGDGAATTLATARRLGLETADPDDPAAKYSIYFYRVAPDASPAAVALRLNHQLAGLIEECPGRGCVNGPQQPGDIAAYTRIRGTSVTLVALLTLIALGALAHSLVTSVRRRRRDLALLKTLGFVGRDVSMTARWQGLALTGTALIIAVPAGILVGRWGWQFFAERIGVAGDARIPVVVLAIAVPLTLGVAALVATIPARLARRTRPAAVLRDA